MCFWPLTAMTATSGPCRSNSTIRRFSPFVNGIQRPSTTK